MNKKIILTLKAMLLLYSTQSFANIEFSFVEGIDSNTVKAEIFDYDYGDNKAVYLFNESDDYDEWLETSGQLVFMDVSPNYTGPESSVESSLEFTHVEFNESVPSALSSYVTDRTSKNRRLVFLASNPNNVSVFEAILSKPLNQDPYDLVEKLNTNDSFIETIASVDNLNSHFRIEADEMSSLMPENSFYQERIIEEGAGHWISVFDFNEYQCSSAQRMLGGLLHQDSIIGLSQVRKANADEISKAFEFYGKMPVGMYVQEFMQFSSIIEGMSLTYLIFDNNSKAQLVLMLNSAIPSNYTGVGKTGLLLDGFNSSSAAAVIASVGDTAGNFAEGVANFFTGSDDEDDFDDEMSLFEDFDEDINEVLEESSEQNACDKGLPGGFHNQSKSFLELTAKTFEAL